MRIAFYTGWLLMVGAFAAAAAETIARTLPEGGGWMLSARELWQAMWPGAYLLSEMRITAMAPWLWDPVIRAVLAPPAWFLMGLPGVILAWTCRPGRHLTPSQEEEYREHEASLFLYDELAREARQWARDAGEDQHLDDRLPTHESMDLVETATDDDDFDVALNEPLPEFVQKRDDSS